MPTSPSPSKIQCKSRLSQPQIEIEVGFGGFPGRFSESDQVNRKNSKRALEAFEHEAEIAPSGNAGTGTMQHEERKAGTSRQRGEAHRFEFEFSSFHRSASVYNQVLYRNAIQRIEAKLGLFP